MTERYIGVFDSGVGGLTLLHRAKELMPHEHFLYYADSANCPYGNKPRAEIERLIDDAISQMMKQPIKAVVLACNTATSVSAAKLRARYNDLPIIGMEPAVKPAVLEGDPRKTLVLATELTLKEKKYKELIKSLNAEDKVDALPMQRLVDFAEEYDFDSTELYRYMRTAFANIDWSQYKSLVLGCTHFLYFKEMFTKCIPSHIHFIDGHDGTINHLFSQIACNPFGTTSKLKCLLSGHEVANEIVQPYLNFLNQRSNRFVGSKSIQ